jgi:histidinol-phosphate aminotransferase
MLAKICKTFKGIVLIDEAYADFADDNCLDFVRKFDNVIISRTMSKSYALAGIRLGYAISNPAIIQGMMKVKDSYNVNRATQAAALAAVKDQRYLKTIVGKIRKTREAASARLKEMNFKIIPSEGNFIFVSPPDRDGEKYFRFLRSKNIITRYFPSTATKSFVRISIGTDKEMDKLLKLTAKFYGC